MAIGCTADRWLGAGVLVAAFIHEKNLLICNKTVTNEKRSLELLDVLTIVPSKKNYRLELSPKGKYTLSEISGKEKDEKICKIIGKKKFKDDKIQINLEDGRNFFTKIKCSVNDSVIIDLVKNEVKKSINLEEKRGILVTGGKHAGEKGKIKKIIPELKMVEIDAKEHSFRALIKQIMVIN